MIFVLVISLLLQFEFYNQVDELDEKSKYFANYILKFQNIEKLPNNHLYFMVETAGCETCSKTDFNYLGKIVENRDDITIIFLIDKYSKVPESIEKLLKNKNIYLDRGKYKRINITPLSDGFIRVKNQKVASIYEVNHGLRKDVIDELLKIN